MPKIKEGTSMNVVALQQPSVPADINRIIKALAAQCPLVGPRVTISQHWVDQFTALTGDDNPIHKDSGDHELFAVPIVPGLLMLALLPRLRPDIPIDIPGTQKVIESVSCRFVRPLQVGSAILMEVDVKEATTDRRRGIRVPCSFQLLSDTNKMIARGQLDLLFAFELR
ncbi:MAG TPA: MaoC/PaaZ C-terminal domain-containing protein [Candidatus Paceibacterota bacterium]